MALLNHQRCFLNADAVIAMNSPSNIEQGKKTAVGLSEKGKDR